MELEKGGQSLNMKAFTYKKYGPPQVLSMEEVVTPVLKSNEVLIDVHALSLNPAQWHQLTASIWMLRLTNGLCAPKQQILGADVAGVVVGVGKNVNSFKVGERVFGRSFSGGLAEFTCLEENKTAKIPDCI